MTKRKAPETEAELLSAINDLFDEMEVESDEEAGEILQSAGYDIDALKQNIRNLTLVRRKKAKEQREQAGHADE